jgi:hypothetical protein
MGGSRWNKPYTMVQCTLLLDSFQVLILSFGSHEENLDVFFGREQTERFSENVCALNIYEATYKNKPAMAACTMFIAVSNSEEHRWRKRQMEQPIVQNPVRQEKLSDPCCVPHNLVERSHTFLPAAVIILQTFAPDKGMLSTMGQDLCKLR